jgi:hypothetical protein
LLATEQALRDYAWSSYAEYLKPSTRRWPWLRVERLLGEMRLPKDSAAGRREFERQMEERRRQEIGGEEWAAIRRGWFFGADELKVLVEAEGRLLGIVAAAAQVGSPLQGVVLGGRCWDG